MKNHTKSVASRMSARRFSIYTPISQKLFYFLLSSVLLFLVGCKTDPVEKPANQPLDTVPSNRALGLVFTPASSYSKIPNAIGQGIPYTGALPSSFELPIPPVPGDQGQAGACASFGCTTTWGVMDHISLGTAYPNQSLIYSASYVYNQVHLNNDCNGGSMISANLDLLKSQGDCYWKDKPYVDYECSSPITAAQKAAASAHKIESYSRIDPMTISVIKQLIYSGHPVIVGFQVDDTFMYLKSGEVWKAFSSPSRGNHCTIFYGWDDNKKALKMLNSWGTGWADHGTGLVDYDFIEKGTANGNRVFVEAYIINYATPPPPVNSKPIADFSTGSGNTIVSVNEQVTFRDNSQYAPSSWQWAFPGASPSTSTAQNPTVSYNTSGTYDVTLTVTNSGGSDTKTMSKYIVVNSNNNQWSCGQPFTDTRDGNVYNTIEINGKCWMTQNLKYKANGIGVNYNNSESNYQQFGRLYSFNDVLNGNLAPAGWHVPTETEARELSMYITINYGNNAGILKSTSSLWSPPNVGANNITGFSALPSGCFFNGVFYELGERFYMWTSTPQGQEGGEAYLLSSDVMYLGGGYFRGSHYFAVRCVKD